MSVNYDYITETAKSLFPERAEKDISCLDFGCGAGQVVSKGIAVGLDYKGADPYPENRSEHYEAAVNENDFLKNYIYKIQDDVLPFPDDYFDFISSNVVFEHIEHLEKPLSEINRVLKPSGYFLALFPTKDTWWEGHVKLYFAHWLNPPSNLCHRYLKMMKILGFGIKKNDETPEKWAHHYKNYLNEYCYYRHIKEINLNWEKAFKKSPNNYAYNYMTYRFLKKNFFQKNRLFLKNPFSKFLLEQICRIRAGRVLLVQKDCVGAQARDER